MVTPKVVVYSLRPSRARYVAQDLIGAKPVGVVVSDRYVVYDYVDAEQRQICRAHLLRDFLRISQRAGQAGRIGRCLLGAGHLLFRWRAQGRSAAQFESLCRRIRRALERGSVQTFLARGFSVHETCRRQGRDLWNFMPQAIVAFIDKTTPPSLLPDQTPSW